MVVLLAKGNQQNMKARKAFRCLTGADFNLKSMCFLTTRDRGKMKRPLHVGEVVENHARKEKKAWPRVMVCAQRLVGSGCAPLDGADTFYWQGRHPTTEKGLVWLERIWKS